MIVFRCIRFDSIVLYGIVRSCTILCYRVFACCRFYLLVYTCVGSIGLYIRISFIYGRARPRMTICVQECTCTSVFVSVRVCRSMPVYAVCVTHQCVSIGINAHQCVSVCIDVYALLVPTYVLVCSIPFHSIPFDSVSLNSKEIHFRHLSPFFGIFIFPYFSLRFVVFDCRWRTLIVFKRFQNVSNGFKFLLVFTKITFHFFLLFLNSFKFTYCSYRFICTDIHIRSHILLCNRL